MNASNIFPFRIRRAVRVNLQRFPSSNSVGDSVLHFDGGTEEGRYKEYSIITSEDRLIGGVW